MENFREMADRFLRAKAAIEVHSGPELGQVWVQLIEAGPLRERMGQAARAIWEWNRGATERCLERIMGIIERERNSTKGSVA